MQKSEEICNPNIEIHVEDLKDLHNSVVFFVAFVSNSMRNSVTKIFNENGHDITHAQWSILMMLWIKDGCQQQELTKMIYKEKTTVTRLIDTLEKKDLLVRVPDRNNKRNKFIYLTNKGKELRSKLTPLVLNLNKKASLGFTENELETLKSYLRRIYENLSE